MPSASASSASSVKPAERKRQGYDIIDHRVCNAALANGRSVLTGLFSWRIQRCPKESSLRQMMKRRRKVTGSDVQPEEQDSLRLLWHSWDFQ